jgi:hypothetical protein
MALLLGCTLYPNSEKDPPHYVINAVQHPSIIKLCCGLLYCQQWGEER